jgi:putative acyl-CoA dehydrogenase
VEAVLAEIELALGESAAFDAAVKALRSEVGSVGERGARRLAELMGVCLQGSLLLRDAAPETAEVFLAARFGEDGPWRTAGAHAAPDTANAALLAAVTPSLV